MSGCLDNAQCECISELGEKRNAVAAIASGILFFTGWWILIAVFATPGAQINGWYFVVGIVGTLSMFMINAISNTQVRGDSMGDSPMGTKGARLWLLGGFVLGFGALIASIWIMFAAYVVPDATNIWPGVFLFLQNFLIFVGSLVYKFGRTEDLWG